MVDADPVASGASNTYRSDAAALRVVGIGASAGGLNAVERFFENVPTDCGMAFVVVQHLSPDFKSLMDEILARKTRLPIHLVEDGMPVVPDHIYLIPPKKEMIISEGRLLLSDREHEHDLSLPIDVFFRSLARDCGSRAVAIVLSGSGSDGSRGVRAVHEAGGLVLIQTGDTAQFDGMPRAARDTGIADAVLSPEKMPLFLIEHAKGRGPQLLEQPEDLGPGMGVIYRMLETEFGIDFTHYKPTTVTRRIERRLQLARIDDLGAYVDRLQRERNELDALYRDLLIGVTRFFRNEDAFQTLSELVLPELLRKGAQDVPVRVWVAGCATGEEVYSLAILLHELSPAFGGRPVKIFATDVHQGSLEIATRALYAEEALMKVSPERLERYFLRRGASYQVVPDLRQMVVFAPHNVIKDAPFTRVDLVTCRNLLIYLQPSAQQKVLGHFHFALNRGGVVFLGPSESPGLLAQDFDAIDKKWRIYRKYSDTRTHVDTRPPGAVKAEAPGRGTTNRSVPVAPPARQSVSQLLAAYDTLLSDFMPPGFLVNERHEVVHVFGGASRFLRLHDGRIGVDVLDMVDGELRGVLLGGLKRALDEQQAIAFKGVRIHSDGDDTVYKVGIRKVETRAGRAPFLLVSFEPMESVPAPRDARESEIDLGQVSREQLGILETELSYTKETLQTTTEELETSNEELQATNEELVASNEELQSTNEELQSVNEELYTVNAEYQRKITDLTELTNDMENLLSSTDIGTIFLDRELKIRKFTARIAESYSLLPQDIGRPIEAFAHTLDDDHLVGDLRRVLETGAAIERELRSKMGRMYFLRVLPYRAGGIVDGVVLTLIDVSGLKAAEDALFHERHLLNSLLASIPDAIYFKDAQGRFIRANHAMAARLGLNDPRDAVGKTVFDLAHRTASIEHQKDEQVIRSGAAQHYQLERRAGPDGGDEWDIATRLPLLNPDGGIVGVIGIFRDVTTQKRAEEKIREAVQRRDEFLAMLSHELRNPLGAVVAAASLLRKDRPEKRDALLQVIERQSRHMARLLDDLLEASRVTQDKIELRKRLLDLRPVIKDAAESVRNLMDGRGHELVLDIDSQPLFVRGDEARLLQIHVNLLSNAAKYTPRSGRIEVKGVRDGNHAVVRIRDNGVGIPRDMLDTVFELFVQSRRTLDRAEGGLGVGLTLVRSLVAMHDGTVSAHSDGEGKGSEFVVRLPLTEGHGLDVDDTRPPRSVARLKSGAKILIVEDNADARHILCDMLELSGFECHSAGDGEAALELVGEVHPQAAVVDIGLPIVDGFEFARRVRSHRAHSGMFLIALTGYGRPVDRQQTLAAGFDEHLVKPVDTTTLLRLLGVEDDVTEAARGAQIH